MAGYYGGHTFPDIPSAYKDSFSDKLITTNYISYNNNETETAVRHIQNELYHVSSDKMYISRSPCSTSGYSEGAISSSSSSRYCSVPESPFHNFDIPKIPTQCQDDFYLESYYHQNTSVFTETSSNTSGYNDSKNLYNSEEFAPFWPSSPECASTASDLNYVAPIPAAFRDSYKNSVDIFEVQKSEGDEDASSAYYDDCCSALTSSSEVFHKRARFEEVETSYEQTFDSEATSEISSIYPNSLSKSDNYPSTQATTSFEEADIIFSYKNSIVCAAEYADDIYQVLYNSESNDPLGTDFMSAQKDINEECRTKLIMSFIKAQNVLNLTKETLHLACYLLDKCLDVFFLQRHAAQDIAAVILVLASKFEEYNPLSFSSIIRAGLTASTAAMLGRCEKRILFELNFKINYPNPFIFANFFHSVLKSSQARVLLTNYILELCLLRSCYRDWGGPRVAHAAVILAHVLTDVNASPLSFSLFLYERRLERRSFIRPKSTRSLMTDMLAEINLAQHEGAENILWRTYSVHNVVPITISKSLLDLLET